MPRRPVHAAPGAETGGGSNAIGIAVNSGLAGPALRQVPRGVAALRVTGLGGQLERGEHHAQILCLRRKAACGGGALFDHGRILIPVLAASSTKCATILGEIVAGPTAIRRIREIDLRSIQPPDIMTIGSRGPALPVMMTPTASACIGPGAMAHRRHSQVIRSVHRGCEGPFCRSCRRSSVARHRARQVGRAARSG